MEDRSENIPIGLLVEPRTVLRYISAESAEYLGLRDSIRTNGLINSICVRPGKEDGKYEVVDGLTRYRCCRDLGLSSIPCIIKYDVSDYDVMVLQVAANALRPETKPVEYAKQMKKIMANKANMTFSEMACLINMPVDWVKSRLGLTNLTTEVGIMVDRGEIPIQSAYMLAKIPSRFQAEHIDQARTLSSVDFKVIAAGVIKRYTEAVKQGKMAAFFTAPFVATPHLRPLKEVEAELAHPSVGALIVTTDNCKTPLDGFYSALWWVAQIDRQSVAVREASARKHRKEGD